MVETEMYISRFCLNEVFLQSEIALGYFFVYSIFQDVPFNISSRTFSKVIETVS